MQLRQQAGAFRTFYQLQVKDNECQSDLQDGSYDLEFTTEIVERNETAAAQQVFGCSGVFKILPKQGRFPDEK